MRVVVFDLDDTLYKEVDFVKSAFWFIARKLNDAKAFDILWLSFLKGENAFVNCNQELHLDIEMSLYLEWYRYHDPSIRLDSDVSAFLDFLYSKGDKIGIITDGRKETQLKKIEALGLFKWISMEDIVVSESFGSSKPSVANYQYFMDRYGNATNLFYYFGDNLEKDFVAPNHLKWETICLLDDGRNIHKQNFEIDKDFLPKRCIRNFSSVF